MLFRLYGFRSFFPGARPSRFRRVYWYATTFPNPKWRSAEISTNVDPFPIVRFPRETTPVFSYTAVGTVESRKRTDGPSRRISNPTNHRSPEKSQYQRYSCPTNSDDCPDNSRARATNVLNEYGQELIKMVEITRSANRPINVSYTRTGTRVFRFSTIEKFVILFQSYILVYVFKYNGPIEK